MENSEKKENRSYIVWSIIMGGMLGFLINVFSNIYYGIFFLRETTFNNINNSHFYLCILLFIGLIGYLSFFIFDYPNTFEFSKNYWVRYRNYFFKNFWPGRILGYFIGIYLLLFLIGILVLIYIFSIKSLGLLYGSTLFASIMLLVYLREKYYVKK